MERIEGGERERERKGFERQIERGEQLGKNRGRVEKEGKSGRKREINRDKEVKREREKRERE